MSFGRGYVLTALPFKISNIEQGILNGEVIKHFEILRVLIRYSIFVYIAECFAFR